MISQNEFCVNVDDPTGNCDGIEGVQISINAPGGELCEGLTDISGQFCCNVDDFPIQICPTTSCPTPSEGDIAVALGITPNDVLLISRHLLAFEGYYGIWPIWADANGDGDVTAADMAFLNNLIANGVAPSDMNWCRVVSQQCVQDAIQASTGAQGETNVNFLHCYDSCEIIFDATEDSVDFALFHVGDANQSLTSCSIGGFQSDSEVYTRNYNDNWTLFQYEQNPLIDLRQSEIIFHLKLSGVSDVPSELKTLYANNQIAYKSFNEDESTQLVGQVFEADLLNKSMTILHNQNIAVEMFYLTSETPDVSKVDELDNINLSYINNTNELLVNNSGPASNVHLLVFTANGSLISSDRMEIKSGASRHSLQCLDNKSGLYIINLRSNGQDNILQIVK